MLVNKKDGVNRLYDNFRTIKTLELDKVLNMLSNEAALGDAADLALTLKPSSDINEVKSLLKYTYDAFNLCAVTTSPNFGRAVNVASMLERCEAGGSMNCKELLQLAETLRVIRGVKEWYSNNSKANSTSLDNFFGALVPNSYLENKIHFIVKSEDEISDNASQTLSEIRRKISASALDIRNKLDRIVKNPSKSKFLQDAIVTQRDGRFVVPVKQEYRSEIGGIVHDTSASGSTLFIEPIAVVEINNDLRVLRSKEKEEIEKILFELSAEAGSFKQSIITSYKNLIELSLIFAKASLAYKMRASMPLINNSGYTYLKNARHPLLDKKTVVPITVELGGEYRSLIITGPNTGGKTVTLKTVGLLTLMTMCGLMIPTDDDSSIAVYDRILVDIGDEQSIEQSLSTFSSHMVNIIDIIKIADDSTLVLLDELGGGTDPVEGAALARAILQHLHNKFVKTIATTHYAELKTYALDTEGVENACCEFNIETLKPTYRLMVGVPGRSNAFAIADTLGIPKEIIEEANGFVSEDDLRFERVVASLEKARQEAEKEHNEVKRLRTELQKKTSEVDSKLEKANAECEKLINAAKNKATDILEQTRSRSDELLNSLEIKGKLLSSENASKLLNEARTAAKQSVNNLEKFVDPINETDNNAYVLPRELVVGDNVVIASLKQQGTVSEIKGSKVLVTIGNIKTWTEIKELRLQTKQPQNNANKKRNVKPMRSESIEMKRASSMEVDIRGFNVEEGLMELDRFIDQSLRLGISSIAIIHGKGTGVLRSGVHSFLKKHNSVASYRLGTFGEGENGVTIVELK